MKNSKIQTVRALGSALFAVLVVGSTGNSSAQVLPRSACAFGKSYEEWSVAQWQWALKLPATHHPLFDNAPVSTGQSGPVWFLGGKFCATTAGAPACNPQVADRTVAIPAGKVLFFPIISAECSAVEGNGTSYIDFRNCVQPSIDQVAGLACELDGHAVANLEQFRVLSPLFYYTLASHDNVWAAVGETVGNPPAPIPDGVTTPAVSDGYFIMLAPLPVGRHVLHFHADIPAFGFSLDVTYHITVAGYDRDNQNDDAQ